MRKHYAGDWSNLVSIKNDFYPELPGNYERKFFNKTDDKIDARTAEIIKLIHAGEFSDIIDPELVSLIAEKLMSAVNEGYGDNIVDIAYNSPDADMLRNLQYSVYQFSAAKNYHQLKDMTAALVGEDGNVRKFKEFKDIATKISVQYNGNWLRTEYDTAIGSGQMASRWVGFTANKKALPTLIYRTVGDSRVRDNHKVLDGVKRKVDDDFWNTYYPPNGWKCRCDVEASHSDYETAEDSISYPDVPIMFRTNLAKSGLVFPKDHPYFEDAPEEVFKKAKEIQKEIKINWARKNLVDKVKVDLINIDELKGKPITFNTTGIKKFIRQHHEFENDKDGLVYKLPEVLKSAKYIEYKPYDLESKLKGITDEKQINKIKQRADSFAGYHYLDFDFMGKKSYIDLREYKDGSIVLYDIKDYYKKKS